MELCTADHKPWVWCYCPLSLCFKKQMENAIGDQVKSFVKVTVKNIGCSPFACTDLPCVLKYGQVDWVQSNLMLFPVISLSFMGPKMVLRRSVSLYSDWACADWPQILLLADGCDIYYPKWTVWLKTSRALLQPARLWSYTSRRIRESGVAYCSLCCWHLELLKNWPF